MNFKSMRERHFITHLNKVQKVHIPTQMSDIVTSLHDILIPQTASFDTVIVKRYFLMKGRRRLKVSSR